MTRKPRADPYSDWLKQEFGAVIDELKLNPLKKRFLTSRWLDQLVWMEKKASEARDRYYRLRLVTIVGAVLVPALVTVTAVEGALGLAAKATTWAVSLAVAISAAIEEFFHYGDRWRNYRQNAERLKTEGWLFFELSGPRYGGDGATHDATYDAFATHIEEIIQRDVEVYLTEVVVEKQRENARGGGTPFRA